MTVYSPEQIRAWDAYTIRHEPISSLDLMERAADKCVQWLTKYYPQQKSFRIFCGKGNNGGDGLAIARMLILNGAQVQVHVLEFGRIGSDDFQANLQRLHDLAVDIHFIQSAEAFPPIDPQELIIDALYGSGLNKPLDGLSADLVNYLNATRNKIVSIDLPSGLFADQSSMGFTVVQAAHTLSFQVYKLGLLLAENAPFIGEVHILDIGLHHGFTMDAASQMFVIDEPFISSLFRPRTRFGHKGSFGHALIIGGSYGKIGAISLATSAALRSGAGLVSIMVPQCGYQVLQSSVPEAMVITDVDAEKLTGIPADVEKFTVAGVGPGMGTDTATQQMLAKLVFGFKKPMVLDADALNCLSNNPPLLQSLPTNSILTPHPKEFERLFGTATNDLERIRLAAIKAQELNLNIVLKGHHTCVSLPDGRQFFNATGNSGMAKGGSGDVLTGVVTALVAQGYSPADAALFGVYLHGLSGDLAAKHLSKEAMTASDTIRFLAQAFLSINSQARL